MSKRKNSHGVLSGRALRRHDERVSDIEQREAEKIARARQWLNLTPEERRQRAKDIEALARIERNGITIDDVTQLEEDAYAKGVNDGREGTFRKIFAGICLALHELHGFDDEQCVEVLNCVYDKAVYALSSRELVQEAFDTVGVELSFDGEGIQEPASTKGD